MDVWRRPGPVKGRPPAIQTLYGLGQRAHAECVKNPHSSSDELIKNLHTADVLLT
jgi:hypothetical protein